MLVPIALLVAFILPQQTVPAAQTPLPNPVAAPAPSSGATPPPAAPVAAAEPVRTCRIEPVTGSRFGRRVCRTEAEAATEATDSREMLRRMQGARVPSV